MKINPAVSEKYPELPKFLSAFNPSVSREDTYWDNFITPYLTVVDAAPNRLNWEFKIDKIHCNLIGGIHGGCIATLIDICSSCALIVYDGKIKWKAPGVTTDLSISYMRSMRVGQIARVKCVVQRCGKNMANMYTEVLDENGIVCYAGAHSKFNVDSRL